MKRKLLGLRSFRAGLDKTQEEMAQQWGMTKIQYERRERGIVSVDAEEVRSFSEKFGVSHEQAVSLLIPAH